MANSVTYENPAEDGYDVYLTLDKQIQIFIDNAGNLLAQNMNSYTVIAYLSKTRTTDDRYPKHVVDKEKTARELAGILEPLNSVMTYEYILGLLNQDLYQVELGPGGRNISEYVKEKIEKLTLPGISFRTALGVVIERQRRVVGGEHCIGLLGQCAHCTHQARQ